ncbi:hypothetical protein T4C_10260 [Trichinella pseudospiralis]|uniref:Uncharacterized protein n=1 Tax=Trichinella pseudospiralis TaxID=6337 RepID=A0A0V1JYX4_TRIPS|nr:hypothetical protein T4C_10260 [Trichinella pseudospiralis]
MQGNEMNCHLWQIYALAAIDDFLRNWIKSPVWGFDIPKAEGPRHIASKFHLNLIILDNPYLYIS